MPDITGRRCSPTLRASCRARLPTHRSIKKDTPRGKRERRRDTVPRVSLDTFIPFRLFLRRPILLRNARLGNVAHAETRRVLRMLSNDGGVGEDDGKRREKFERKKREDFSSLDGTFLVGISALLGKFFVIGVGVDHFFKDSFSNLSFDFEIFNIRISVKRV